MNTRELAEATAEFDEEFVIDTFGPLTPEARARWEEARRQPPGPKESSGTQVISVRVDRHLLARSDALASRMGLTRSALVARALKAVLAVEGEL
jgi:hypothetical protein